MGVLDSLEYQLQMNMLELSSERICVIDTEGLVHDRNEAFQRAYSEVPSDESGFSLKSLFQEEDYRRFLDLISPKRTKEKMLVFTGVGLHNEPLIVKCKPIVLSDSQKVYYVCFFLSSESFVLPLNQVSQLLSLFDWHQEESARVTAAHQVVQLIGEMAGAEAVCWCPYIKEKEMYSLTGCEWMDEKRDSDEILWVRLPESENGVTEKEFYELGDLCELDSASLIPGSATILQEEKNRKVYIFRVEEEHEREGAVLVFQDEMREHQRLLWNLCLSQLRSYLKKSKEYAYYKDQFQKFKFGINAIGVATWEWDLRKNTIIFSRKWAEMMGYSYEELSNRIEDWKEHWHPDELHENERLLLEFLSGETTTYSPVHRMRHKDGHWKWIMTRGHLSKDAEGNPLFISGFHVDITESENMRALFLQERERFLNIIEATRAGTWEWNVQTGEALYNDRWAEILGYTLQELEPITNDTWRTLVHPEDLLKSDKIVQSLFFREKEFYSMECRMRHKEGHWVWVLDNGKVVTWTEDGKPLYMFGTHIDITESKLLEMEIKQREDNYRLLVESSYDIVYRLDKDGIFLFISTAWEKVLGHSIKGALGKSFEPYVHPEDLERIRLFFRHIEDTGRRMETTDYRLLHQDGTYHWFTTNAVPIKNEQGEVVGFTGIARDTTEVKAANLKILEQKDELERFFKVNLDYFCITDSKGSFIKVNDAWEKFLGFKVNELIGENALDYVHPEDHVQLKEIIRLIVQDQQESSFTLRFRKADGSYVLLEWKAQKTEDLIYAAARDVTEKIRLEENLFIEKELFRTTLLSVGDGVIATDEFHRILLMNSAAETMTGWDMKEAVGRPIQEVYRVLAPEEERPLQEKEEGKEESRDKILLARDYKRLPVEESISPITGSNQSVTGIVVVFRDITEKFEKQRQAEYLSYHDVLTGLYNRRFAEDLIKKIDLKRNLPLSIMVMDLNGLKLANDAFGHDVGDLLLIRSAEIMKEHLREQDVLARMGGDEFMMLMPKTTMSEAEAIKIRIMKDADASEAGPVQISIAAGIATKTLQNQNILEVEKVADNNMYREKLKHGKVMKSKMIETILSQMGTKFPKEKEHLHHVAMISRSIGEAMGMSSEALHRLYTAGKLHDIGKISVPKEILLKSGPLTYEEFEVVKKHAETSYQIIKSIEEYGYLAEDVLYHHERYDGTGYPEGLKGDEIPLHSRILAIADAFEAMTHERPYSRIRSIPEAVLELQLHAGTQFDPEIVQVFVEKVANHLPITFPSAGSKG